MDFYAMIHAFWLIAVLYRRRRKAIAEIWPKYCCFLACIITFQYFLCIGIPPAPCKGKDTYRLWKITAAFTEKCWKIDKYSEEKDEVIVIKY